MDYSGYRCIQATRRGRILTLAINRPEALNAVNGDLHGELSRIFYDAALDHEADIIVLTGTGRAFCAGGDIKWMQDSIDRPALFESTAVEAKKIIFGILDCEKPIVCRMNGDAVGLGATIALFCDIIIAAESARIGDPHVRVGLVAGDGGTVIWPQLIGFARAKEFLMTGDLLTAKDAERIGLINHAVPDSELDARVSQMADKLATGATKAIRWTKTTANIALKQIAHSMMDAALSYEMMSNLTRDHQEAVTSFKEKRKPVFRGE